jgi:hypothetical protein
MTKQLPDRWTTQQTDDLYAEHVHDAPPRCPVCRSKNYRLTRDHDHDQHGAVTQSWRECERCGHQGPRFVDDDQDPESKPTIPDPNTLPSEPAWLTRLAKAKTTYHMGDFEANMIARYVRGLREAAWPIVRALEQAGDEANWAIGDETDRVYPWYEIEPLKHAVLGTRKEEQA